MVALQLPSLINEQPHLAGGAVPADDRAAEMRSRQPSIENADHRVCLIGQQLAALRIEIRLGRDVAQFDERLGVGQGRQPFPCRRQKREVLLRRNHRHRRNLGIAIDLRADADHSHAQHQREQGSQQE